MALIPALDAATTVGLVVEGALKFVQKVLVVDDGSADGTAREARRAGAEVVSHANNMGKGEAIKTGLAYAVTNGFEAVVTLDADGQHDPSEIPRLTDALLSGADIVVGSRLGEKDRIPKARYYTNLVGVVCISWRAGCHIDDTQSGFRVYRTGAVGELRLATSGFETETEILIKAGRRGRRIVTVPVRAIYPDSAVYSSHFRPVRDTYKICMVFLRSLFWPRDRRTSRDSP